MRKQFLSYINSLEKQQIISEEARKFIEKYIDCMEKNPSRFIEAIPKHLVQEVKFILEEANIEDEGIFILLNDRIRLIETYG